MKSKIYLSYFNESQQIKNDILTPIQVGADISALDLNMIKDNNGENISSLNPFYCEMTGVYWAWKNDKNSDYIGSFHYRRLLDFNFRSDNKRDIHGMINYHYPDQYFYEKYGLDEDTITKCLEEYDAVLPETYDVKVSSSKNIYDHYSNARHHFKKDLDLCIQVVSEKQPKDSDGFKRHLQQNLMYATNVFVLRRDIFEDMCAWIFGILDEIYNRIKGDLENYTVQEKRVIGYLAERLMSYYFSEYVVNNNECKSVELGRLLLRSTNGLPPEPELPNTDLPILSLTMATDQNYVGHLASLIASIIDNHEDDVFIEMIILDGGLTQIDHIQLNRIIKHRDNCSLSFIPMKGMFEEIAMHSHFTVPTLYRLFIAEFLLNRDKILYLDIDMTVVGSLLELYNINVDGYYAAAVKDLIMRTFVHKKVPSHEPSGGKKASNYLSDYLELKSSSGNYFQAGTILFNLEKMRQDNLSGKMIDDLTKKDYWFLDQDILNKYMQPHVKMIDNKWNVVTIPEDHRVFLKEDELEQYNKSHQSPVIIHYAGVEKPWVSDANPHGHYYWSYLRKTPWYETMLFWYVNDRKQVIEQVYKFPTLGELFGLYYRRTRKVIRKTIRKLPI